MGARLLANSKLDPLTGCRTWTGKTSKRHGGELDPRINVRVNGRHKARRAHRVSYEEFKGPIPGGYEIDHKCFNTLCIEHTHLEAVTHQINVDRRDARAMALNVARSEEYADVY
jgi:hypothetical protein